MCGTWQLSPRYIHKCMAVDNLILPLLCAYINTQSSKYIYIWFAISVWHNLVYIKEEMISFIVLRKQRMIIIFSCKVVLFLTGPEVASCLMCIVFLLNPLYLLFWERKLNLNNRSQKANCGVLIKRDRI